MWKDISAFGANYISNGYVFATFPARFHGHREPWECAAYVILRILSGNALWNTTLLILCMPVSGTTGLLLKRGKTLVREVSPAL
jgi:hypothetical protein